MENLQSTTIKSNSLNTQKKAPVSNSSQNLLSTSSRTSNNIDNYKRENVNLIAEKNAINDKKAKNNDLFDGRVISITHEDNTTTNNIFINGIRTSLNSALDYSTSLFKDKNGNKYLLYNSTQGPITDGVNTICGKISDKLENELSSDTLASFIIDKILNKNENVFIHAHSQGTIITNSALEKLHSRLSKDEFKKICQNLTLHLYGAATFNFPEEIHNIVSYENQLDPVISILGNIGDRNPNIITIKGNDLFDHNMWTYIKLANEHEKEDISENNGGIQESKIKKAKKFIKDSVSSTLTTVKNISNEVYEKTKEVCKKATQATKNFTSKATSWTKEKFSHLF